MLGCIQMSIEAARYTIACSILHLVHTNWLFFYFWYFPISEYLEDTFQKKNFWNICFRLLISSSCITGINAITIPTKKYFHHSGGIPVEFHWNHGKLVENDWNKWNLWNSSEIPLEFQQLIILTSLKFHLSKIFVENWR